MIHFLRACGPFGLLQVLLAFVIAVLVLWKAKQLFFSTSKGQIALDRGLHAIIFWGVISLVLGILGQCMGIYNATQAIAQATEISPKVILAGLGESYTTVLFGLVLFLISAICWFTLYSRYTRLSKRGRLESAR